MLKVTNTASVQVGVIGRTIYMASATSKFHRVPNSEQALGKYFCNRCRQYFTPSNPTPPNAPKPQLRPRGRTFDNVIVIAGFWFSLFAIWGLLKSCQAAP